MILLTLVKIIYSAALGSIIGSFILVVRRRMHVKTLKGRSRCDACGTTLSWRDLVPLVSYLSLRGRCRHCESRISPQHFWVEVSMALLYALHTLIATDMLTLIVGYIVFALLAILVMYDAKSMLLPGEPLLLLVLIGILYRVVGYFELGIVYSITGFFYVLIPSLVLLVISLGTKGRAMGLGDPILLAGLSLVVGTWQGALFTLLFASWIGLLYVGVVGISRYRHMENGHAYLRAPLPFAPALAVGFLIAWWGSLLGWFVLI